jgi:hypothetical protein
MNRRNLLKTFLAAPAIIRSGVLMPIVPLVAAPKFTGLIIKPNPMSEVHPQDALDDLARLFDDVEANPQWRSAQRSILWVEVARDENARVWPYRLLSDGGVNGVRVRA